MHSPASYITCRCATSNLSCLVGAPPAKMANPLCMQNAHQSHGKHPGNGQHGMGSWLSPSKLQKRSHNILTFCSRYSLLHSKVQSVNLFLIFVFYLAATGKAFTNAINAVRKVLNRLSGFSEAMTFSWVILSGYYR